MAYLVDLAIVVIVIYAYNMRSIDMLAIDEKVIDIEDSRSKSLGRGKSPLKLRRVSIEMAEQESRQPVLHVQAIHALVWTSVEGLGSIST